MYKVFRGRHNPWIAYSEFSSAYSEILGRHHLYDILSRDMMYDGSGITFRGTRMSPIRDTCRAISGDMLAVYIVLESYQAHS
jgi:hypothetical protein